MKKGPGVEKQLGFRPECECGCLATVGFAAHQVDECAGQPPHARLLCGPCLEDELVKIQGILLDGFLGLRPEFCNTCGLHIVSLRDIIVRIQPLWCWDEEGSSV